MIGDLRAVEPILLHLFRLRSSDGNIELPSSPERLFGDYSKILKDLFDPNNYYEGKENYLSQIENAIEQLGRLSTPASSNLLLLIIRELKDIKVIVGHGCGNNPNFGELSFENIRNKANDYLRERGNPVYNPAVFLQPEAWKL
jgi:hypothetical protein